MTAKTMHPPSAPDTTSAPPAMPEGPDPVRALLEGRAAVWNAILLVTGPRARAEGWGPEAAVAVAQEAASDGRPVVLAELDFESPSLHLHLGVPNDEGAADVVLFGASVRRTARPVEGLGFSFLPSGDAPDPEQVLAHRHWSVARSEVGRAGGLLLFYAPFDAPGLRDLGARVGHALALAEPDEVEEIRRVLGSRCEVAAALAPGEALDEPAREAVAAPLPVVEPPPVAEPQLVAADDLPQADTSIAEPVAAAEVSELDAIVAAFMAPHDASEPEPVAESEPALAAEPAPLANLTSPDELPAPAEAAPADDSAWLDEVARYVDAPDDEVAPAFDAAAFDEIAPPVEDTALPDLAPSVETSPRDDIAELVEAAPDDDVEPAFETAALDDVAPSIEAAPLEEVSTLDEVAPSAELDAEPALADEAAPSDDVTFLDEVAALDEVAPVVEAAPFDDVERYDDDEVAPSEELEPEPVLAVEPAELEAEFAAEHATELEAEPVTEFAAEPADLESEPVTEFAAEPAELEAEPATEFAAETAELEPEPVTEFAAEPATELAIEPAAELQAEPAMESVVEPETAAEPAMEFVAAPEPDAPVDLAEVAPELKTATVHELPAMLAGEPVVPAPPVQARKATRYSVPRLPKWQERMIRVLAVVTLAYGVYYISWRWTQSLNTKALWFSIPLVLAETWGLLTAFIMVHSVWRLKHRDPVTPPEGLSADVFITSFDEPLEVIRRTCVGARAIRYPHRTYILDDGKRDEVKAMAAQLGIGYLRREDNAHAKSGNLNHALKHTRGDFVLQLDADHVPLPHILDRLLGFFEDPKLAFVQAPQDFYNTDGFTYDVNESWQRIWEEQRLFFSVIQPGKDSINGAFFCGSCAVFRREALESIGGFGTHSITEDIETSLLLHAAGWRSAYYGESLAYGLAAGSATAFHVQHLRWGQGAMQVLRRFNPLSHPGLTLSQRVSYFGSLTAYVGGVQKLVFYCAPLVFFLTGALPIKAVDREFLLRFLPFLLLSFILSDLVSRGTANTWMSERYQMAKFWTYTRAVASVLWPRPLRFTVTPKGPGHVPFRTYAPQVVLMVTTLVALAWATMAHRNGWVQYGVDGWASTAFRVNLLWASLNFILAASVIGLSLRVRQQRGDHRFRDQFPITLRTPAGANGKPRSWIALTEDLNPTGIAFRMPERLPAGSELRMKLPLTTGSVTVRGKVVHEVKLEGPGPAMYRIGVAFDGVPLRVRDAIELHCIQHAVPLERAQYTGPRPLLARTAEWTRNARRERREQVRLPARVWLRSAPGAPEEPGRRMALLAEISASGARLVMDEPVPEGTLVRFVVPGTRIRGVGRAVFSQATETPIGVRFAIGVRRSGGAPPRQKPVPERKMAIPYVLKKAVSLLCIPLAAAAAAVPASAQLQAVVYGGAEMDTQDLALFLLGASVHTTGLGPGVGVGVMGYNLTYPVVGNTTESVNAVQPQVELRYGFTTGSVQANVGYLFIQGKDVTPIGAPGGAEDGLVTALQGNYWGSEGGSSADLIVSYNWGGEYFWTRGRGMQQIAPFRERGGISLGAELVAQGTAADDTYRAFQAGPVLEVALSPAFRLIGVAGAKTDNRVDAPSVFPYFKLEFVAIPGL
ncbi:MAG TPA: glycosyltransferase [Longimicrobium sp.]